MRFSKRCGQKEADMSSEKILGRGTKRKIAQIRWKRWEVFHALVLFALMAIFSVFLAVWFEAHHFD
jgi:hypothetical protein